MTILEKYTAAYLAVICHVRPGFLSMLQLAIALEYAIWRLRADDSLLNIVKGAEIPAGWANGLMQDWRPDKICLLIKIAFRIKLRQETTAQIIWILTKISLTLTEGYKKNNSTNKTTTKQTKTKTKQTNKKHKEVSSRGTLTMIIWGRGDKMARWRMQQKQKLFFEC